MRDNNDPDDTTADVAPTRLRWQLRWWRPGGFRWPWLARATRGRLGLGRWTEAEVARHHAEAERWLADLPIDDGK